MRFARTTGAATTAALLILAMPQHALAADEARPAKISGKQVREDRETCLKRADLTVQVATEMVRACSFILTVPPARNDTFDWIPRIHQQKALALIMLGQDDAALAEIDTSDGLGRAMRDPLFDNATGLGNDLLRAFALNHKGDRPEALKILAAIRAKRPYSLTTWMAADTLEAGLSGDLRTGAALMEKRIKIDPDTMRRLPVIHLVQGNIAQAIAMNRAMSDIDPKLRRKWKLIDENSPAEQIAEQVDELCTRAYIASIAGDPAAAANFASARSAIDAYQGKDPRQPPVKLLILPKDIAAYLAKAQSADTLRATVSEWESIAQFRVDLRDHTLKDVMARAEQSRFPAQMFLPMADMLQQIALRGGSEGGAARTLADELISKIQSRGGITVAQLASLLPMNEHLDLISKFDSNNAHRLVAGSDGYDISQEADGETFTVRFESVRASPALIEEQMMLASAQLAIRMGKDRFILLSNRTLSRQVEYRNLYSSYVSNEGFEAQARIQILNADSLQSGDTFDAGRLFDARAVSAALAPQFAQLAERKKIKQDADAARLKKQWQPGGY